MPRIGLRALGVNLDAIKDMTIAEVYGTGILSVPECNKRFWKLIKEKNLKVKLQVASKKQSQTV
jgi:hypothetical protein